MIYIDDDNINVDNDFRDVDKQTSVCHLLINEMRQESSDYLVDVL